MLLSVTKNDDFTQEAESWPKWTLAYNGFPTCNTHKKYEKKTRNQRDTQKFQKQILRTYVWY